MQWLPRYLADIYSRLLFAQGNDFVRLSDVKTGKIPNFIAMSRLEKYGWARRIDRGIYVLNDPENIVWSIELYKKAVGNANKIKNESDLVILFGSVSDGTATKDSDIDLMIISDDYPIEPLESKCLDNPLILSPDDLRKEIGRGCPSYIRTLIAGETLHGSGFLRDLSLEVDMDEASKRIEESLQEMEKDQIHLFLAFRDIIFTLPILFGSYRSSFLDALDWIRWKFGINLEKYYEIIESLKHEKAPEESYLSLLNDLRRLTSDAL